MRTEPVEATEERALLDNLLRESRLYHKSPEFMALLDFTAKLRNFAPFNAMLLHIQKPGLLYAASRYDWLHRFNRTVTDGARPLLILWPFGPVALVYDVADTEGGELPEAAFNPFPATGDMTAGHIGEFSHHLRKKGIEVRRIEFGSGHAGTIHTEKSYVSGDAKIPSHYIIRINKAHDPNTQFATLAHELAHLFLGHLGPDKYLKIPLRPWPDHDQAELEAETVSYLVCRRNGVWSRAEVYLADYVANHETVENLELYHLMKAAGQVEAALCVGEVLGGVCYQ